jgi:hypothetical protein
MVQNGGTKMNQEVSKDLIEFVNSMNDFVKSKSVKYGATNFEYVPLDDILDRCKKSPKWAVQQQLSSDSGMPTIQTILIHESGYVHESGHFPLVFSATAKPQDIGSVITYMKRYQLGSFLGLATETDNDANPESEVVESKATPKQVEMLSKNYVGENLAKLLEANKIKKLEDISMKKASELIGKFEWIRKKLNDDIR